MTPFIEDAKRLLRLAARDQQIFLILCGHPEADLVSTCFHAQQAVEKSLKAVLAFRQSEYRRTHDLEELAYLIADTGIALPVPVEELRRLNPFAVELRYDDEALPFITREESIRIVTPMLAWADAIVTEIANAAR